MERRLWRQRKGQTEGGKLWNHTMKHSQQGEVWSHTNKGITDETELTWIGKFRLTPPLRGLTEINSKGSGYKTSLTWGAIALPRILWLLERQSARPSDLFVICEDSCLPTAACAPGSLSTKVKPGKDLWCGQCASTRQDQSTQWLMHQMEAWHCLVVRSMLWRLLGQR